jgi:hypothetical protein
MIVRLFLLRSPIVPAVMAVGSRAEESFLALLSGGPTPGFAHFLIPVRSVRRAQTLGLLSTRYRIVKTPNFR